MIRGNNQIQIHRCMTCRYFLAGTWGLPADDPHSWCALVVCPCWWPSFYSFLISLPSYLPCWACQAWPLVVHHIILPISFFQFFPLIWAHTVSYKSCSCSLSSYSEPGDLYSWSGPPTASYHASSVPVSPSVPSLVVKVSLQLQLLPLISVLAV